MPGPNNETQEGLSGSLSPYQHMDPEKHMIGESLAVPSQIVSGVASVGVSPIAAREDHSHGGPLGLVAWKLGTLAAQVINTTPLTIYTIAATLIIGRLYEITFTVRAMNTSAGGGNYIHFTGTNSPAASGMGLDIYAYAPAAYGAITWSYLIYPVSTASHTITIKTNTGAESGGIGGILYNDGGSGIWIKDVGPVVAAS